MTFSEAEEYLLSLELFGMRFGLDRMCKLMTALGSPQERFASIHVVGSNGKSSTVRFTAALLERHGLSTGSYTSPHLRSFPERVEVRERPVSDARFAAAVARAARAARTVERTLSEDDAVTQFEALTAAAYGELAESGVEVAVVEAGLGGRYDATNVIGSRVQILTGVGLEHTRWLGPKVTDIAEEKLAVVTAGGTLVTPELEPSVREVAERVVAQRGATLVVAPRARDDLKLLAPGAFQRGNFALAAAAAEAFRAEPLVPRAVRAAAAETRIPGRLDVVAERPRTIYDGAHNPAGAKALAASVPELLDARAPLVLVLSVLEDKDAAAMLAELVPLADRIVFTRCANPRALSPATLESLAGKLTAPGTDSGRDNASGLLRETVPDPRAAVVRARELAGADGAVLATGSIYLIADLVREPGVARASTL